MDGEQPGEGQRPRWTFLTNHAHVLLCLARHPDVPLREVAAAVGITLRGTQSIVADLEAAGYLERRRQGRGNVYAFHTEQPLRHPLERDHAIGELLDLLTPERPAADAAGADRWSPPASDAATVPPVGGADGDSEQVRGGRTVAETILYEVDGRVATVTLNRPEKLNAITVQLQDELLEALQEAEADPGVHVAIVAGAGRGFCAGYDVGGGNTITGGVPGDRDWLDRMMRGWLRIWDLRLAVVAKVHGVCLAGGTQLANICDVTWVAADARVGTPQLPLGAGYVSSTWAWAIGPKKAKEIFFPTGTTMSGQEAVDIGLFNGAFPADRLDDAVAEYAARVSRTPKDIIALQKQAINQTQEAQGFRQAMLQGVEIDAIAHTSPAVKEVNRFIAQRGLREALRAFKSGELL